MLSRTNSFSRVRFVLIVYNTRSLVSHFSVHEIKKEKKNHKILKIPKPVHPDRDFDYKYVSVGFAYLFQGVHLRHHLIDVGVDF